MTQLRIESKGQTDVSLSGDKPGKNNAGTLGVGKISDAEDYLSDIIDRLNEIFGTDFDVPARGYFESVMTLLNSDAKLETQARNNSRSDFRTPFESAFINALFASQAENEELFRNLSGSAEAMQVVKDAFFNRFYDTARNGD